MAKDADELFGAPVACEDTSEYENRIEDEIEVEPEEDEDAPVDTDRAPPARAHRRLLAARRSATPCGLNQAPARVQAAVEDARPPWPMWGRALRGSVQLPSPPAQGRRDRGGASCLSPARGRRDRAEGRDGPSARQNDSARDAARAEIEV